MTTADVDVGARIGEGSVVWHLAQIREGAELGDGCVVGRGAYVDAGVRVGRNCKLQNYALVYAPARLGDGVFVGPAAVLTNDVYPRSVGVEGERKQSNDWEPQGVVVDEGASIGAHAVVVGGVHVGRWSLIGAGAVVTRDVPDFALVVGSPARRIGWVGRSGRRLERLGDHRWRCPQTGATYLEDSGCLSEER